MNMVGANTGFRADRIIASFHQLALRRAAWVFSSCF